MRFLRAVVREYIVVDKNLGRFHVCETDGYHGQEKRLKELFIEFEKGLQFSSDWKQITRLSKALTPADLKLLLNKKQNRVAD
jgi:hypothetical protein